MFKRISIFGLLIAAPVMGCDTADEPTDSSAPVGGKADSINPDDFCPADTFITRAANDANDHVFTNCHDGESGQFTARSCCASDIELVEDISGCPAQVKFTHASSASQKRCVNDVAGHSGKGQFVSTACCAPLCEPGAQFGGDGSCRNAAGQFEETICCLRDFRLTASNCSGANWETLSGGSRDFACRADNGQFTFDACCVEQCAETISRTGLVPESCSFDITVEDECPGGSSPNAGGICHNPENGQFVKAACCDLSGNVQGLDRSGSDACWAGQQTACG